MSALPPVTITRRACDRLASGHPWIYRVDVERTHGLRGGEIVTVLDGRGWFHGIATYSSKSQIALRLLSHVEVADVRELLWKRLAAAKALRESLYPGEACWRAVHGESDLLPGLVVDRYGDALVVQLLTQATDGRRELICDLLTELYQPKTLVERSDAKVRLLEGLEQRKGLLRGVLPERVEAREGAISFRVDLLGGQKTGAFLDQRENHLVAGDYAKGRGLDCFSYVGGFALQLARRCDHVTAVEISDAASQEIEANARAASLSNVEVAVGNAFDFLHAEVESPRRYDTIVLDPPAFAKSKAAVEAATRGYKEINLRALQLLEPGGILMTSSCSFHISEEHFESIIHQAATDARREVQVLERRGAGRDHPVLLGVRETRYLKFWILRAH